MEGFVINIIATAGFSVIFLAIFFLVFYLYLKGAAGDIQEEDKIKDKDKRLGKRILK